MSALPSNMLRSLRVLGFGTALMTSASPALAQETDHSKMHMPVEVPAAKSEAKKKPAQTSPAPPPTSTTQAADPHAGHVMAAPAAVDHAAMGHEPPVEEEPVEPIDHAAMGHKTSVEEEPAEPIDHAAMGHDMSAAAARPHTPVPVLTDADRVAAFPDVAGHPAHDNSIQTYWLLDRLEGWNAGEGTGVAWEAQSWIGTDLDRVWLRSEGERSEGVTEAADIELLYGRSVSPWWDVVAGVRHDFGHGPSQTFAALGVMGVAPYKYEVEATAYLSDSGQASARIELEYDTLLTNRLILQSLVEFELYGKDDEPRGIGSGLSTAEVGFRLRYEFTRKFAPYIGVIRERAFGDTAAFRGDAGEDIDDTRFVVGLRTWF